MVALLPFFVVLFAGLFFSEVFDRLHLPWVIALILTGVFIGPFGLDVVELDPVIVFLSEIGLVFLMFMAGLETRLSSFRRSIKRVWVLALINGLVPAAVGIGIGMAFGYSTTTALLIGVIFISSSIAVVIPSLEAAGVFSTPLGHAIVSSTILQDIAGLALLSVFLQSLAPQTPLPLPAFYILLVGFLIFLRWVIPKLQWFFHHPERDVFQQELRSVFAILIGTVVIFQALGLHAIIGGFFAGLVLSESITSKEVHSKLRALSYGLFIPIFFVVVGMKTDIGVFIRGSQGLLLAAVITLGSMIAKYVSGYVGGRIIDLTDTQSKLVAASSIPQLSTTLAVVFTAAHLGLINADLSTAFVVLTVVTTFVSPLIIRWSTPREPSHKHRVVG